MTFAGAGDFYVRNQPDGSVERNVADPGADDGFVARLRFRGNPALGNTTTARTTTATASPTTPRSTSRSCAARPP